MPLSAEHIPATSQPAPRPMLGIALRIAAVISLGIMFMLVKLASSRGVHVGESLFWRQLAGLPVAIAWLWFSNDLRSIPTVRPGAHALRMVLGIAAMACNFTAMVLLPMADATTLGFATQIFATILAALLLGEPTGRYRWSAITLGFVGIVIALRSEEHAIDSTGAVVAIAGALMTAGAIIQMRRLTRTESPGAIVFWFSLTSTIPLGIAQFFVANAHDNETWLIIAGLSLAGAVSQILITASLRYASVATNMTLDYGALIWSAFLGFMVFGDVPASTVMEGAPLIIGAGLMIAWREHHLARKRSMAAAEYLAD
jgi:drug/metabolite transporter (DMT)-like permease